MNSEPQNPESTSTPAADREALTPAPIPYLQLALSGLFMGLANLVPGVSGGTMILVLGMYDEFIAAFSEVTRLRITFRSVVVLALLFGIALVTVFGFASGIQYLMETSMTGMLALFIGMTLGGTPLLYKEISPLRMDTIVPCVIAFILMALLAFVFRVDFSNPGFVLFIAGGMIGSAAMILPGISGSYILLILGLYLPIIGGVSAFKDALQTGDIDAIMSIGVYLVLPVGIGFVIGLGLLTNVLKFLLSRYHRATLGFLFGLLLGSVFGLYPFKEPVFDKLPRYAVDGVLHVYGYGWEPNEDSIVWRNLVRLEDEGYVINVIEFDVASEPDEESVRKAGSVQGIVLVYDQSPANTLRRLAEDSTPNEVHIEIVPNTEFTTAKGLLAVFMVLIGFAMTYCLGMLDPKRKKKTST